jgi:poly(A) polymerase Pap1
MINETYQGKKGKRHLNSIEENFKEKTKAKCISCFIVTDNESFNPMTKFSLKSYTQEFYSLRKKEELFRSIIAAPESNLRKKHSFST